MKLSGFLLLMGMLIIGVCFMCGVFYYQEPKRVFQDLCAASLKGDEVMMEECIDRKALTQNITKLIDDYMPSEPSTDDTRDASYSPVQDIDQVQPIYDYSTPTGEFSTSDQASQSSEPVFSGHDIEEIVQKLIDRTFRNIAETDGKISVDNRSKVAYVTAEISLPGKKKTFIGEFRMHKVDGAWRVTDWQNVHPYMETLINRNLLNAVLK